MILYFDTLVGVQFQRCSSEEVKKDKHVESSSHAVELWGQHGADVSLRVLSTQQKHNRSSPLTKWEWFGTPLTKFYTVTTALGLKKRPRKTRLQCKRRSFSTTHEDEVCFHFANIFFFLILFYTLSARLSSFKTYFPMFFGFCILKSPNIKSLYFYLSYRFFRSLYTRRAFVTHAAIFHFTLSLLLL